MNLRTRPSALLAAFAVLSLTAPAQELGPQKVPGGDAQLGPAAWDQSSPFIEAGATSSLAVWVDSRTNLSFGSTIGEQTGRDVLATRLDAQGLPLEATPFVISMAYGEQTSAQATWNGSSWLVTWANQTATPFYYEQQVWGVRVGADGTLLDPTPFSILASGFSLVGLDVASNGSDWLVVAQGDTGGGILGVRVAADGTLVDTTPKVLVPPTFFLYFDIELTAGGAATS